MTNGIKVSIVIAVKEINDYIYKSIPYLLNQSYKEFEILIIPNKITKNTLPKQVRLIPSGDTGPAQKRDLGVKKAKGEIIAFIDDDAYPERDWLKNAISIFENKDISIVGGPNLTPKESNFFQKLSGEVLASYIVSGPAKIRYKRDKYKEYDDLPSCNLIIRKKDFLAVKGFDTSFWPGEDTKLCLDIKKLGKKIIYSPEVVVYHHRRKDLQGYLKQIGTYSVHRGYFAKKYPETSFKISYFVPTLFVLGLFFGLILSYFSNIISTIYLSVLSLYLILLIIESIRTKKLSYILPFISLVFVTHIIYGLGIIKGILKKDLRSKYRK